MLASMDDLDIFECVACVQKTRNVDHDTKYHYTETSIVETKGDCEEKAVCETSIYSTKVGQDSNVDSETGIENTNVDQDTICVGDDGDPTTQSQYNAIFTKNILLIVDI